ncbi:UDPglucose--hexose-1-phosphate uridylyltransferase [Caldanaerobius fijiensis DSM 17918]|uniref:Galactose-1-phosphate uridylyltransferase n=1 Tax=Caldanaerobius fijiensis DSM 17918 TaxID=1121256 RepID=A0A1M5AHY2_9THEO|nr:galactose-1-phosphate uridylyltransferase [Caldanaerobius fijiensis]SHF29878.1 UDPglucose--hexose-1-phosphate uridylyltransferase [Caldanaerobius fijiensis DSM 17918]
MPEIRQDPFTDKMVIIAKEREKRPLDLKDMNSKENSISSHSEKCPFCIGNEHITPTEVGRIERDGEWKVRVVPNKFPILSPDESIMDKSDFYRCSSGYGFHEVIIETMRHDGSFFNMSLQEFNDYLQMLVERYHALKKSEKVKYISIYKNYLKNAGASLEHPHSQILTMPIVPPDISREMDNAKKYYREKGHSLHDMIMSYEREKNERFIHESTNFMIIAPYASMYNNEIEIINKDNGKFEEMGSKKIEELAALLKKLFQRMYAVLGEFPFNMFFHTHAVDEKATEYYKWHIHVTPRMSYQAGFELATGVFVNAVAPESVAQMLKW